MIAKNSIKVSVYSLIYIDCLDKDADADIVHVDMRSFLPPYVKFSMTALEAPLERLPSLIVT